MMMPPHLTTRWLSLLTFLVLFLIVCDILWIVHKEYIFERELNSLFITTDDFTAAVGPSYKQALFDAGRDSFNFDFSAAHHSNNTIPQLMHYIWYDNLYPPPPSSRKRTIPSIAPELCVKHNPGFTIKIWNEADVLQLLHSNYPWFLPTYSNYAEPVQRVDAAKYFILLEHGGIYADHDVSCRKGLYPLLDFAAWFPRASPLGVNNDLMAARKGHPLMKKMVARLDDRNKWLVFPWLTIFWSTGPRFTTDVLHEYLVEQRAVRKSHAEDNIVEGSVRVVKPDSVSVLPASMYSEELQFFGHTPGGTWYRWDVALVLWIGGHWYLLMIFVLVVVVSVWMVATRRSRSRLFRILSSVRRRSSGYMNRKDDDESSVRLLEVV